MVYFLQMKPATLIEIEEESRINNRIGEFFRNGRMLKRMTVREVVLECRKRGWNTGPTSINRIEKGYPVGISRLYILCKIYDLSPRVLLVF